MSFYVSFLFTGSWSGRDAGLLAGGRMLTNMAGDGVFYMTKHDIFELTCSSSSCSWKKKQQKFKQSRRDGVAMYVPDDITNCY